MVVSKGKVSLPCRLDICTLHIKMEYMSLSILHLQRQHD